MDALAGRTALVTGAGRGIGRAIALGLAQACVTVGLAARSEDQLAETAERVREAGAEATVLVADLATPAEAARLATRALDALGSVDILINNAGVVAPLGP